ncbi:MAG: hypothetical protein J0L73_28375 [Verrucomicrobia bacterium]|nr:hypothetical protein [Verrucomicrobiota bacterium]
MNTDTPDLLTPSAPPVELPGSPVKVPQRNALKFNERTKLSVWLNTDDMRARAAKESDATLATEATEALGFDVTAANITSMRVNLGIAKAKPEKPAPDAGDVDVVLLFQQVQALNIQNEQLKIRADGTDALIATLRAHIHYMEKILLDNSNRGNITFLGVVKPEQVTEWPLAIQPPAPTATAAQ